MNPRTETVNGIRCIVTDVFEHGEYIGKAMVDCAIATRYGDAVQKEVAAVRKAWKELISTTEKIKK